MTTIVDLMNRIEAEQRSMAAAVAPALAMQKRMLAIGSYAQSLAEVLAALGATWPPPAPAAVIVRERPEPVIKPKAPADWLGMLEQALEADKKAAEQALALIVKHAPTDAAALRAELLELEDYERKWLKVKGRVTPQAFVKRERNKSRAEHYRLLDRLKEVRLLLSALGADETQ
jgi:phytoene dehydrogenase-like protein